MKKITTKKIIIKTIEEECMVDTFISNDGTVFDNEQDCLEHDKRLDFLSFFKKKYRLKDVNPELLGNFSGQTPFCHIIYIEKINDATITHFSDFYELKDYPEDLIKIKEGWSFVCLNTNIHAWMFDEINRTFIVKTLNEVIEDKTTQLNILLSLTNNQ